MSPMAMYFVLLVVGSILVSAEMLVPGGILGVIGGGCILASAIVGWIKFDDPFSMIALIGSVLISIGLFILWLRVLPKTGIALRKDAKDFKAPSMGSAIECGATGETLSSLRPSGFARICGRRIDVITEGEWLDAQTAIEVVRVEGASVFVRAVSKQE